MSNEKAIVLNYLYFLRANKVQTMAIEVEYDGEYHIHLYKLADVIAFVESLQGDEIMQLEHVHIYSQVERIKWRPVEQTTRKTVGGYDISKLAPANCDLKLNGYGKVECKAMSGMWCFGDKRDERLEWIVG